jgi:signal transduction histidine kinase
VKQASLRFSSSILARLGEELNPNPDQGILELVKNAYDADARQCVVALDGTLSPRGSVVVSDDGEGMTAEELTTGFLVLGSSSKSSRQTTRLGRIPAGNKGLGRLAAMRLGHEVRVSARSAREPNRTHRLRIDWDRYDNSAAVDEVALSIETGPREEHEPNGTTIEIVNLRSALRRADVKRLARSLVLLADPFDDDPSGFSPVLNAPEFTDLEKLVRQRYFDDADYHLIAELDAEGFASARAVDWRGETLFAGTHGEISSKGAGSRYKAPPSKLDLWVYLLNTSAFATRTVTLGEVREWLAAFGGVHMYINGLRVAPYGNSGNDWLEMNLRRAASPEERPSTNTSVGRMSTEDREGRLVQKTDRSGLIEDETYEELRRFGRDATDWLARRRLAAAEARRAATRTRAPRKSEKSRDSVRKQIDRAPEKVRAPLTIAFDRYDKAREQEADRLRGEVQLYRTLATAGITAATFAHESTSNPLKVIRQSTMTIERRARERLASDYETLLQRPVDRLKAASAALSVLSSTTLGLVEKSRRRPRRIDLNPLFSEVIEGFKPFLTGRDVEIEMNLSPGNPYLRGTAAAIESILINLLNNALTALEDAGAKQRRIAIRSFVEGTSLVLVVEDNGPGVDLDRVSLDEIWLPGVTTHETGLGLTIVRDAVLDLGGAVAAKAKGELGGAEFSIHLPILGA